MLYTKITLEKWICSHGLRRSYWSYGKPEIVIQKWMCARCSWKSRCSQERQSIRFPSFQNDRKSRNIYSQPPFISKSPSPFPSA